MAQLAERSIDFDRLRTAASLRSVVESYAGQPLRSDRVPCPVHGGEHENFCIEPDGLHARCWVCGWRGDVVDLIATIEGLSVAEAAKRLDPAAVVAEVRPRPRRTPKAPAAPKFEPWRDAEWQSVVGEILAEAERVLWTPEGRPGVEWLRARGLVDATIRRFRCGFVSRGFSTDPLPILGLDREGKPRGVIVARGVVLPWPAPGSTPEASIWLGATIRRLAADGVAAPERGPKCVGLTGSRRGYLYPDPEILPAQEGLPALIVEGELDALAGWQEAGHLAHVLTVGGASQSPHPDALAALKACPRWLVNPDADEAGARAALRWLELDPARARRVLVPHGKDLNAFHLAGGDVRKWVLDEIRRHPWEPAPRPWNAAVATWRLDRWVEWRRRSVEIEAAMSVPVTAADVRLADRRAFEELSSRNGGSRALESRHA